MLVESMIVKSIIVLQSVGWSATRGAFDDATGNGMSREGVALLRDLASVEHHDGSHRALTGEPPADTESTSVTLNPDARRAGTKPRTPPP